MLRYFETLPRPSGSSTKGLQNMFRVAFHLGTNRDRLTKEEKQLGRNYSLFLISNYNSYQGDTQATTVSFQSNGGERSSCHSS